MAVMDILKVKWFFSFPDIRVSIVSHKSIIAIFL